MKTAGKKQYIVLGILLLFLFSLPFVVFFTGKKQDFRPKAALSGQANFLLSSSNNTPKTGESFDVLVSLQLTNNSLRVSGVDFLLLYDANRLEVTNIVPQIVSVVPGTAFDEAVIVSSNGDFTDEAGYKFLRVAEVAKRGDSSLLGGTVSLAKVTFYAKAAGSATVKFPNDNKYLSIVGTSLQ